MYETDGPRLLVRATPRSYTGVMSTATATAGSTGPASPVTLEADYEPVLSRWLWLVKWLLAGLV